MSITTTLESFLKAVPEAGALVEDAFLGEVLSRLGLDLASEAWDFSDRVDLVTRLLAIANRRALASLEMQVGQLASCADAVSGARQRWTFFGWIRGEVVFASAAGELAALPIDLAWQIHTRGRVDIALSEEPGRVLFLAATGEVVAALPRALLPRLLDLLASAPWERRKSRRANSQSHDPHEIPSGTERGEA